MSYRPDWSEWILQKNSEAKQEELKKNQFVYFEPLEKAIQSPFKHRSHVRIVDSAPNKGYKVQETLDPIEGDEDFVKLSNNINGHEAAIASLVRQQDGLSDFHGEDFHLDTAATGLKQNAIKKYQNLQNQIDEREKNLSVLKNQREQRRQHIIDNPKPPTVINHENIPFTVLDQLSEPQGFHLRLTNNYDGPNAQNFDRHFSGIIDLKGKQPKMIPPDEKPHTPRGEGVFRARYGG